MALGEDTATTSIPIACQIGRLIKSVFDDHEQTSGLQGLLHIRLSIRSYGGKLESFKKGTRRTIAHLSDNQHPPLPLTFLLPVSSVFSKASLVLFFPFPPAPLVPGFVRTHPSNGLTFFPWRS